MLDLLPQPASATRARQAARDYLSDHCPAEVVDTVALLVTELVTNAVIHARTELQLIIDVDSGCVGVRVTDAATSLPAVRGHDRDDMTGRGLTLVDTLATEWGVEPRANGKVVWCNLHFDRSSLA